jgi:mRNA interferase RelE/StbE
MAIVRLAVDATEDFDALPPTMRARVLGVFQLLQQWPKVSGAKPLRGDWAGHYRIRTGDWRIIFQVVAPAVIVVRIKHRSQVYEE